jgi:hypothetical protein
MSCEHNPSKGNEKPINSGKKSGKDFGDGISGIVYPLLTINAPGGISAADEDFQSKMPTLVVMTRIRNDLRKLVEVVLPARSEARNLINALERRKPRCSQESSAVVFQRRKAAGKIKKQFDEHLDKIESQLQVLMNEKD